jgi:nucleoside-diphosphate-sugar epimerase
MASAPVLVTGGTGFIAKHCIAALLREGRTVRASVRDLARARAVTAALGRAGVDPSGVTFIAAELGRDEGWREAVAGCEHVLHVASPFPMKSPRLREELLAPAREGTRRVLRAAAAAGVRRIVLTSSIAACVYPAAGPEARTYTEADWTDPARPDISAYVVSKTLAERAAWDFVRETPGAPELSVINPAFVLGPALDADLSTSHEVLAAMARGAYPAAPRVGYAIADVRDVARAHIAALTRPGVAGERFIVASGYLTFLEMARLLAASLPDRARKVPRFEVPDLAIRGLALFDRALLAVVPDLGVRRICDGTKACRLLGLEPRSPREAVRAAAESLRTLGVV